MKTWINGKFVEEDQATISVFDAGFQHGVGLFETMAARNGEVFRATDHMERLARSASELRLTEKLHIEPLVEALQNTLSENDLQSARLRLTVTGGDLNLLQRSGSSGGGDPTIVIQAQPPTEYPSAFFEKGVVVSLASGRINPYEFGGGHKTLNYWSTLLNLQIAAMQSCSEALRLTPSAVVTGGCVSNIFVVRGETLFTPSARGEGGTGDEPSAVLPGITRSVVVELGDEMGVETVRGDLTLDGVLGADEVFLTNSSWGVLPVVGILASVRSEDGESEVQVEHIGDGSVGKLTTQLLGMYHAVLEKETSSAIV